jgi:hypothetical protein
MGIANDKRLLSKEGRVTQYAHLDGDDLHIETIEDCQPLVDAAKILADKTPGKDFRLAAIVPGEVFNQAFREGWLHDKAQWKKWMNDPDNKRFRVWGGRM